MSVEPIAPDLLVLGSGGVLGDVWMTGVVAGLIREGEVDPRASAQFTGTSAGSIVATRLAAGEDLEARIRRHNERAGKSGPMAATTIPPGPLDGARKGRRPFARLVAGHGPTGRLVRRRILSRVPTGQQELKYLKRDMEALAPEWPDRLNITAFNVKTGKRVVFSRGNTHGLTVSEAVQASCAIPTVFRPIEVADGSYVDGGVWSPVNLDAVRSEPGDSVVCLTPSGSYQGARGVLRRTTGSLARAVVEGEVARLRATGVRVANVVPDRAASLAIGPNRMANGRELEVYEAGLAQARELATPLARWLEAETKA